MPEREALFSRNQQWCHQKWGRWVRLAWPAFDPLPQGSPKLHQWLERLVRWARRRTHVYVYYPSPPVTTKDTLFRSVGLIPHADIHWHAISRQAAPWAAALLILKRRKKPFDIIVAPDAGWDRAINRLRWCHGAAVVPQGDEEQLLSQWKAKSRSPS